MTDAARPDRVVYGVSGLHDSLFFAKEPYITELADEVNAVKACSTVGAAMFLDARLQHTFVPGVPEDPAEMESEGVRAEDAYDWSATGSVEEGDWPPMLTQLSLDVFERDDREAWSAILGGAVRGKVEFTALNGDILLIQPDRESALCSAFDELGVRYRRDDEVRARIESGLMD
jgi:hypothetical protein